MLFKQMFSLISILSFLYKSFGSFLYEGYKEHLDFIYLSIFLVLQKLDFFLKG